MVAETIVLTHGPCDACQTEATAIFKKAKAGKPNAREMDLSEFRQALELVSAAIGVPLASDDDLAPLLPAEKASRSISPTKRSAGGRSTSPSKRSTSPPKKNPSPPKRSISPSKRAPTAK